MEIKILGGCCKNCETLLKTVNEVLEELHIKGDVSKVTDFIEIAKYGVMKTPGLVIDNKVIFSGRVPDKTEIKEIFQGK